MSRFRELVAMRYSSLSLTAGGNSSIQFSSEMKLQAFSSAIFVSNLERLSMVGICICRVDGTGAKR